MEGVETARTRWELAGRLRKLRGGIEDAAIIGMRTLPESQSVRSPEYLTGLREALEGGLDYVIAGIEKGEGWTEPIPPAVAAQARRAARSGIRLDTVLRRYAAGDRLLAQMVIREAENFPLVDLRRILAAIGPLIDRLMAAVAEEYLQEVARIERSPDERLAERVQWHLEVTGPVEAWDLDYELDAWHLGMVLTGAGGKAAIDALAKALKRDSLVVLRGSGYCWAWLGGNTPPRSTELERLLDSKIATGVSVAIGEPRHGIDGWRQTHREAYAAFEVMIRKRDRVIHSADAVILAAVLRDESLATSLIETFLAPLDRQGDAGDALRITLRAYLRSGCNATTTAATLDVNRHTVKRRIHKIEKALGRLIPSCHAQLDVALSLEELIGEAGVMTRQLS